MNKKRKTTSELFEDLFKNFQSSFLFAKTKPVTDYIKSLGLNYIDCNIGYNSGQFHHSKDVEFKKQYEAIGILSKSYSSLKAKGQETYTCFGSQGIIFPLRNSNGDIVNLFSKRYKLASQSEEFLNQNGIYPGYPDAIVKRIYLLPSIIDAASIIQSKVLFSREAALSLFNGALTEDIAQCVKSAKSLSEIIIIKSEGGSEVRQQLLDYGIDIPVVEIMLPEGHSMNDMLLNYGQEGILEWMTQEMNKQVATIQQKTEDINSKLIINKNKIIFKGNGGVYEVLGRLPFDYGNLSVTLAVSSQSGKRQRIKVDLYNSVEVEAKITDVCSKDQELNYNLIEGDFTELTNLLEEYREKLFEEETSGFNVKITEELSPQAEQQAMHLLQKKNLMEEINNLLGKAGIVGEETVRQALFIIASTFKMQKNLHCLVQGVSGSGKSHLLNTIAQCIPNEDVISFTRVTNKSFYNYSGDELINKLVVVQDIDGLGEEAQYALRELQTAGKLCSSTTQKDITGNIKSKIKVVNAHFTSLTATTQPEVYYDNMSRSIILGIDEGSEQTEKIIDYQNKKQAGIIDEGTEESAKRLLRNCLRLIKQHEVVNPYAAQLALNVDTSIKRRLNEQFQSFIAQITLLNQYQRKLDNKGRLVATIEDVKAAIEVFFPALWLKIDEIDSSTRQFFESLKNWLKIQPMGSNTKFTERDVRHALNIKKTRMNSYMNSLKSLGYISVVGGSVNRGYQYSVTYWDDFKKIKEKIKQELYSQIDKLSEKRTLESATEA